MILKKGTKYYCPVCGLEIIVTITADTHGCAFICCDERMVEREHEAL